jgi:uncharacterized protein (TIGR00297 family)
LALDTSFLTTVATVTAFCSIMAAVTYKRRIFNLSGSVAAFVVGMLIGICGSLLWLVLLTIFLASGFGTTKFKFEWKRSQGFQEGRLGERTWRNVAANGAVPSIIALASFVAEVVSGDGGIFPKDIASYMFVTSIAVALADTTASEVGIVDPSVILITDFKKVPRGTDGGISLTGTFIAFVAAAYTSVIAYVLFATFDKELLAGPSTLLVPMLCGFFGCQVDSVIGATWERGGRIGKLGNNFLSIATGTLLALAISAA